MDEASRRIQNAANTMYDASRQQSSAGDDMDRSARLLYDTILEFGQIVDRFVAAVNEMNKPVDAFVPKEEG